MPKKPKAISASPSTVVLVLAALVAPAPDALAYFDPASGSLVLQMILGGIAGVAVIFKLYWHKLLDLLGVERSGGDEDDEGADADIGNEADADGTASGESEEEPAA